jgi:hypothetical protein
LLLFSKSVRDLMSGIYPTPASLTKDFGLAPLIGKPVAIFADARFGGRSDQQAVAERLLSISGEDGQTISRKYIDAWTGRLTTRFLIISNELPRFGDASGALAKRFVILTLKHSFYDKEDHGLEKRFSPELPGILNWALEGRDRLIKRGHFVQRTPVSLDRTTPRSARTGQRSREAGPTKNSASLYFPAPAALRKLLGPTALDRETQYLPHRSVLQTSRAKMAHRTFILARDGTRDAILPSLFIFLIFSKFYNCHRTRATACQIEPARLGIHFLRLATLWIACHRVPI